MKKVLVIIPARAGSKGLKNKNILNLKNKPLIHYTIEAAQKVFKDSQIVVSTDSKKIKVIAEKTGVKIKDLRPNELAKDYSGMYEVLLYEIKKYELENGPLNTIILLQPTSPLRSEKHLRESIKLYNEEFDMIVSVNKAKSNPYFNLFEEDKNGYLKKVKNKSYHRRQDCPDVWEYNGAIFIINVNSLKKMKLSQFKKVKKYVMDEYSSIDIDNELDFKLCEIILNENN